MQNASYPYKLRVKLYENVVDNVFLETQLASLSSQAVLKLKNDVSFSRGVVWYVECYYMPYSLQVMCKVSTKMVSRKTTTV